MKRTIFYSLEDSNVVIRKLSECSHTVGIAIKEYLTGSMPEQGETYEFWDGDYYFRGYIVGYRKSYVEGFYSHIEVEVYGTPKTKEVSD